MNYPLQTITYSSSFSAPSLLLGDKGNRDYNRLGVGGDNLTSFARPIAPVVTTTFIILQNSGILVLATMGCPGKMIIKEVSSSNNWI